MGLTMMLLVLFFAILFGVAALATFAGWIWLVIRGFGKSAGWGLLMLFLCPFAAIAAAMRDWSEWKRPFLLYYGSFGAQVLLAVLIAIAGPSALPFGKPPAGDTAALEPTIHKVPAGNDATGTSRETAVPEEPVAVVADDSTGPIKPVSPSENGRIDPTGRPATASMAEHALEPIVVAKDDDPSNAVPDGYEEVAVASASTRVGSKVRIVARDGRIHKGTLTDVENGRLHVNFEVSGGTIAMDFGSAEIRSLQVRR